MLASQLGCVIRPNQVSNESKNTIVMLHYAKKLSCGMISVFDALSQFDDTTCNEEVSHTNSRN